MLWRLVLNGRHLRLGRNFARLYSWITILTSIVVFLFTVFFKELHSYWGLFCQLYSLNFKLGNCFLSLQFDLCFLWLLLDAAELLDFPSFRLLLSLLHFRLLWLVVGLLRRSVTWVRLFISRCSSIAWALNRRSSSQDFRAIILWYVHIAIDFVRPYLLGRLQVVLCLLNSLLQGSLLLLEVLLSILSSLLFKRLDSGVSLLIIIGQKRRVDAFLLGLQLDVLIRDVVLDRLFSILVVFRIRSSHLATF